MSDSRTKLYLLTEAAERIGADDEFVIHCMRLKWIEPADPIEARLDEEDIARAALIRDLQREFGVNDESVSIILHLLDQIHWLQKKQQSR